MLAALPLAAALAGENPENPGDSPDPKAPDWGLCGAATARAEHTYAVPEGLLAAIAKTETGRWNAPEGEILAWPWTVNAGGQGRFFPSKAAAIAAVEALQADGVDSIDVGCLQVNLVHHPDAFADLDQAFDPAANADYAARFLAALYREHGTWPTAAAHYHSATRARNRPYRNKVMAQWQEDRGDRPNVVGASQPGWTRPDLAGDVPAGASAADRLRATATAALLRREAGVPHAALAGVLPGGGFPTMQARAQAVGNAPRPRTGMRLADYRAGPVATRAAIGTGQLLTNGRNANVRPASARRRPPIVTPHRRQAAVRGNAGGIAVDPAFVGDYTDVPPPTSQN